MTAAGGTTTIKQVTNVGDYTLWELSNTEWSSDETVAISSITSPLNTSSNIMIVGASNEDLNHQISDGTITAAYAKATMTITVTDSGATDDVIRVFFYHINDA